MLFRSIKSSSGARKKINISQLRVESLPFSTRTGSALSASGWFEGSKFSAAASNLV